MRKLLHEVTAKRSAAMPYSARIRCASTAMVHIGPEKHSDVRRLPVTSGAAANR